MFYNNRIRNSSDPVFSTTPESLSLQIWNDVSLCHMLKYELTSVLRVAIRGDYLANRLSNIYTVMEPSGYILDASDSLVMCKNSMCSCSD